MKKTMLTLFLLALTACGGSGGPSSPDNIPDVRGTYTGPVTLTVNGTPYPGTITMRITVAQAGAQVTITGQITVSGQVILLPAFSGMVSATGAVSGGSSVGSTDQTCGYLSPVATSLTFAGRSATYVEQDSSQFCGNLYLSGVLTR